MKTHPTSPSTDDSLFLQKLIKSLPSEMKYEQKHYERLLRNGETVTWSEVSKGVVEAYRDVIEERKSNRSKNDRPSGEGIHFANVPKCYGCGAVDHKVNTCPRRQRSSGQYSRYNVATRGRGGRGRGRGRGAHSGSVRNENGGHEQTDRPNSNNESGQSSGDRTNRNQNRSGNRGGSLVDRALHGSVTANDWNTNHSSAHYMISSSFYADKPRPDADQFVYDDGSEAHVVNRLEYFKPGEYKPFDEPRGLESINGGQAHGVGCVQVISVIKGQKIPFNLKNVLYIPTSPINIFSEGAALDNGLKRTIGEDEHYHYKGCTAPNGDRIVTARRPRTLRRNGHYLTSMYVHQIGFNLIETDWHDALGCASYDRIYATRKCVDGMKIEKCANRPDCTNCFVSKSKRRTFNHQLLKEKVKGRVLHTDICDLPVPSRSGNTHFIVFGDEASKYSRVYFMKSVDKEDVWEAINQCFTDQLYDIGTTPRRLHTDKGGAYTSKYVLQRLAKYNCKVTDATTGNHEQNGYSEKLIEDLMNMARAMLKRFDCPNILWEQALSNANYVKVRLYSRTIDTCPFFLMHGYKPNIRHLKPFGCPVYVHIDKKKRGREGKLADRAKLMRFVGHTDSTVVFNVTDKYCRRIYPETNVHFFKRLPATGQVFVQDVERLVPMYEDSSSSEEDEPPAHRTRAATKALEQREERDKPPDQEQKDAQAHHEESDEASRNEQNGDQPEKVQEDEEKEDDWHSAEQNEQFAELGDASGDMLHEYYDDLMGQPDDMQIEYYDYLIEASSVEIPTNFKQIEKNAHAELWYKSTDKRFLQYMGYETWELVPEPTDVPVLNGHWRFDLKTDEHGYVEQFKTRWVIDGSDIEQNKYAPVIDMHDFRLLLAFAAKRGYLIHTIDCENAYLNSDLPEQEVVYMKQIFGYVDTDNPTYVCKLKKSLFGLPTSAYNWYRTLCEALEEIGLIPSKLSPCIFYSIDLERLVAIHVDDLALMAKNIEIMNQLKAQIAKHFKFKDNGPIRKFLGMEFDYNPEKCTLKFKQTMKIRRACEILASHKLPAANKLPIQPNVKLDDPSEPFTNIVLYQRVIGLLNYIATHSRPDIAVYVAHLAKHMKAPTKYHFKQLCYVVSYLKSTENVGLVYKNSVATDDRVYVFADAGEQGIREGKGRRTTGIVCTYNRNIIHWSSKRQTVVTSDICHAELYGINAGLRVGIGFRNRLAELNVLKAGDDFKIPLMCDNKSAIEIVKPLEELRDRESTSKKNPRHYDLALLYVRDFLERKECELDHVPANKNVADIMTKFVDHAQFEKLKTRMCLGRF